MTNRYRPPSVALPVSPLLITESADEFDRIKAALYEQIRPCAILEEICVADIVYLTWEIIRYQQCKAHIINAHFRNALTSLLNRLIRDPTQYGFEVEDSAEELARKWFTDKAIKKQVKELLELHHLDESAIRAEAFRQSASQLEQLDRIQASLEARRDRVIRSIPAYRSVLAELLRDSSDKIVEGRMLEPTSALSEGRADGR